MKEYQAVTPSEQLPPRLSFATVRKLRRELYGGPAAVIKKAEHFLNAVANKTLRSDIIEQINLLFLCAEACDYLGFEDRMDTYIERCEGLAPQLLRPEDKVFYLQYMGVYHFRNDNNNEAVIYMTKALRLAADAGLDDELLLEAFGVLGRYHYRRGQYERALAYQQRRLSAMSSRVPQRAFCPLLCDVARIYVALGKTGEAESYFEHSVYLARHCASPVVLARMLMNHGQFLADTGRSTAAVQCLRESSSLARAHELRNLQVTNLLLLGRIRLLNNALDDAQLIVDQIRRKNAREVYLLQELDQLYLQGEIFERKGALAQARATFYQMTIKAALPGMWRELALAYRHLSDLEEQRGELAQALLYYKIASRLRQSLSEPGAYRKAEEVDRRLSEEVDRRLAESGFGQGPTAEIPHQSPMAALPVQTKDSESEVSLKLAPESALPSSRFAAPAGQIDSNSPPAANTHHDHRQRTLLKDRLLARCADLSPAEIRICLLIGRGYLSKEIAGQLHKSVETVNSQRKTIRRKLHLDRRENLATFLQTL